VVHPETLFGLLIAVINHAAVAAPGRGFQRSKDDSLLLAFFCAHVRGWYVLD